MTVRWMVCDACGRLAIVQDGVDGATACAQCGAPMRFATPAEEAAGALKLGCTYDP